MWHTFSPCATRGRVNPPPLKTALLGLALVLVGCGPRPTHVHPDGQPRQREMSVAAAADLQFALDEVVGDFEREHPDIQAKVTYGSSGSFFAQLSNEAPFDLYLSADINYPRKLMEQGKAVKGSEFLYAVGHLVVGVPAASKLDVQKLGIRALADPSLKTAGFCSSWACPWPGGWRPRGSRAGPWWRRWWPCRWCCRRRSWASTS